MSSRAYKQDMPPPGGFGSIRYAKLPKSAPRPWVIMNSLLAVSCLSFYGYRFTLKEKRQEELEMRESGIAMSPFIRAENMRTLLKHMVKNREEERRLMQEKPFWDVGKLYSEPVFHNIRDRFIWPTWYEVYMHNDPYDLYDRVCERRKH